MTFACIQLQTRNTFTERETKTFIDDDDDDFLDNFSGSISGKNVKDKDQNKKLTKKGVFLFQASADIVKFPEKNQ